MKTLSMVLVCAALIACSSGGGGGGGNGDGNIDGNGNAGDGDPPGVGSSQSPLTSGDLSLVPDAAGPAPRLKEVPQAASFEELVNHVAPGFVSEKHALAEVLGLWQPVSDQDRIDLKHLHFLDSGALTQHQKVTVAGQSCVQTLFSYGKQLDSRDFNKLPKFARIVASGLFDNQSVETALDLKVLTETPAFASISYESNRIEEQMGTTGLYTRKSKAFTSHVGVQAGRFLEAYELVDTEFMDEGKAIHWKSIERCVRLIEPAAHREVSSCSVLEEWGKRELFDYRPTVTGTLVEKSKVSGQASVKHWEGEDLESGISKMYFAAQETGVDTAHFIQDYRKMHAPTRDGYVYPHYKHAEGDLTFVFGADDQPAGQREVDDCKIDKIDVEI